MALGHANPRHIRLTAPATPAPKAIHIRLSHAALTEILSQAKGADIRLCEQGNAAVAIKIGSAIHPLHSVKEDQPHDVYGSPHAQSTAWTRQGKLQERLLLESDMGDRLRQRTEAAVAEKGDRHIVVLTGDPHSKGKAKGLSAQNAAPSPAQRTSVSPVPKPRQTPRLVATGPPRPKPVAVAAPETKAAAAPPAPHNEPSSDAQELALPGTKTDESSADSASSSAGTSFNFSSSASTSSSRTSTSSGDSPPSKEPMQIDTALPAPHIAISTATPLSASTSMSGLGFTSLARSPNDADIEMGEPARLPAAHRSPTPSGSSSDSSKPLAKLPTPTKTPAKAPAPVYNPMAPPPTAAVPPPAKRSRTDFESSGPSSSDERSRSKPGKPQANARTAGGSRLTRPANKLSPSTSPDPASGASTPVASALPSFSKNAADRFLNVTPAVSPNPGSSKAAKKRKSESVEMEARVPKKRKAPTDGSAPASRPVIDFTSSESEGEALAGVPGSRGRSSSSKPLRPTPSPAKRAAAASPLSAPTAPPPPAASPSTGASAVQITSQAEYRQQHARFTALQKDFATLCTDLAKYRKVLETFVAGRDISADERLAIPSKREAEQLAQRALAARTELEGVKRSLWTWAKQRAATST